MQMQLDCVECIMLHAISTIRNRQMSPNQTQELLRDIFEASSSLDFTISPPEFARLLHNVFSKYEPEKHDHFEDEKNQSTLFALKLLPILESMIAQQEISQQFESIIRIIVGANIIDYGADRTFALSSAQARIMEVFTMPFDVDNCRKLETAMNQAQRIFYILDNCGEAVFDRLLIDRYRNKITLGVRGKPIFNDITPQEIALSGLNHLPWVDTNDNTPGVSLSHSSEEFLAHLNESDLIIAKGQGNFESMEGKLKPPCSFLLRVKCPVISRELSEKPGALKIILQNF